MEVLGITRLVYERRKKARLALEALRRKMGTGGVEIKRGWSAYFLYLSLGIRLL